MNITEINVHIYAVDISKMVVRLTYGHCQPNHSISIETAIFMHVSLLLYCVFTCNFTVFAKEMYQWWYSTFLFYRCSNGDWVARQDK